MSKGKHELTCSECEYWKNRQEQQPCIQCISEGWDYKELHEWQVGQRKEVKPND